MIDEYGEALIPDLLQYYNVDLRDLFAEKPLSPRWLLNLVVHLPLESAFNAARRGGQQYRGWDAQAYALADIATSLRLLQFLYTSAHIDPKKGRRPDVPKPFPTPDYEARRKKEAAQTPGSFMSTILQAKAAAEKRQKAGVT